MKKKKDGDRVSLPQILCFSTLASASQTPRIRVVQTRSEGDYDEEEATQLHHELKKNKIRKEKP